TKPHRHQDKRLAGEKALPLPLRGWAAERTKPARGGGGSSPAGGCPAPAKPEPRNVLRSPPTECRVMGDTMSQPLVERYQPQIAGTLSCYDRVVIAGTLPVARQSG